MPCSVLTGIDRQNSGRSQWRGVNQNPSQFLQYGESLRVVPVAVGMEAEEKVGFAVQNQPKVVFFILYFDYCFIFVPLVGVEIECRNEL